MGVILFWGYPTGCQARSETMSPLADLAIGFECSLAVVAMGAVSVVFASGRDPSG